MDGHRPELGDWSSVEQLHDLQRARLPRLLARAARSPFYQKRFAGGHTPTTVEDFFALELTLKQDLRDAYPWGMLAVDPAELATYHESSGSAGTPTPSFYTAGDWHDLAERYARKWVGINADDVFLVRTPYALMITGHLAHAAARLRGATVIPGDCRSLAMPMSRVVRVLHDLNVTLTWGNPTETMMWAASARAAGLDPATDFPALRALFVSAEPLTGARRNRISEIWGGIPVVEEYGATETGTLAGAAPDGTMRLWADRVLFEVLDPQTGRLQPEGRGTLVATPLYRDAMPLLRYHLADEVEVSYRDADRDSWFLPTVRVLGRSAFEYRVHGIGVTQERLEELIFGLPREREVIFWRARAEQELLTVEFEVPPAQRELARAELGTAIDRRFGVPHRITPLPPGSLVPDAVLTADTDVLKPRSLFGPHDNWDKSILYF
ncbi:phenylacetate--CoA ligase family protein [Solwaraspora sp. WMMB335]|uniref:phenylacetate--CoA ligase family protein n=1 Tax=Solwaraspora sp. WMMB335 TaxID=3404118 RepID=UPI003B94C2DB